MAKSRNDLIVENRILKAKLRSNTIARIVEALAKWGCIAGVAYYASGAVSALAGKSTWADLGVRLEGFSIDCKWAIIVGAAFLFVGVLCGMIGIIYGLAQRRLRQTVIETFSPRITNAERILDPQRTGAGLTLTGQTRPEGE